MLKLYKKGKFDIAIYAIPSVILLVLVLLLFGTFFFTEFSKPSDLSIETKSINADISLINFLRTEVSVNGKNMEIYNLIQSAYENQNSVEANELKNEYALFKEINEKKCPFLKITSVDSNEYIVIVEDEYKENIVFDLYRNLHACGYPKEIFYTLIPNKDSNKKGFIVSIGE